VLEPSGVRDKVVAFHRVMDLWDMDMDPSAVAPSVGPTPHFLLISDAVLEITNNHNQPTAPSLLTLILV